MNCDEKIIITNIAPISAIYFALLQCGYDYYLLERNIEHVKKVKMFYQPGIASLFFSETKQNVCDVYKYWPRAAMLETATFYISNDMTQFSDYDAFQKKIMSAVNISDADRGELFWKWISDFPNELKQIFLSKEFKKYLKWENTWIQKQNTIYAEELQHLRHYLDFCINTYHLSIKHVQVALSPIKCAYSCDYHMLGERFIFCSGAFKVESVIHEILHHAVHAAVLKYKNKILEYTSKYKNIDSSYYLNENDVGKLNAFEEFLVRALTKDFFAGKAPLKLEEYINVLSSKCSKT